MLVIICWLGRGALLRKYHSLLTPFSRQEAYSLRAGSNWLEETIMAKGTEKVPVPEGSDDIDWSLLLLLARVEASLIWPDQAPLDEFRLLGNTHKGVRH